MGSICGKKAKKAKKASNVHSRQSKFNLDGESFKFRERQETMQKMKRNFCRQRHPMKMSPCGQWVDGDDDFSVLSYLCEDKKFFLEDIPEFRCGIPAQGEVYRIRLELFDITYLEYDGRNKLGIHRFRLYGDGVLDIAASIQSGTSKLTDHIKFLTDRISQSVNGRDFIIIHDDGKIQFSDRKSLKGIYGTLRFRYPGDDYQRIILYFPHIQKATLLVKQNGKPFESSTFFWYEFYERDEQANSSDAILGFETTTDSF